MKFKASELSKINGVSRCFGSIEVREGGDTPIPGTQIPVVISSSATKTKIDCNEGDVCGLITIKGSLRDACDSQCDFDKYGETLIELIRREGTCMSDFPFNGSRVDAVVVITPYFGNSHLALRCAGSTFKVSVSKGTFKFKGAFENNFNLNDSLTQLIPDLNNSGSIGLTNFGFSHVIQRDPMPKTRESNIASRNNKEELNHGKEKENA